MAHFFVTADQVREDGIHILGADVNHLKNVLRMKIGEHLSVSDGNNVTYSCAVESFPPEGEEVILRILSEEPGSRELPSRIYLFQGLPKGDKMELIIQKAVELGAFSVIPVEMRRSVAKIDPKKKDAKLRRFRLIAESAAKQAGRSLVPGIPDVMNLREALSYAKARAKHLLLPYELEKGMAHTREVLSGIRPGEDIAVFIGPEGGFDVEEAEFLSANGAEKITLGKRILRTETAGLMLLSVLMFRLEED